MKHIVSIQIASDSWDYILRSLDEINRRVFETGPLPNFSSTTSAEGIFKVESRIAQSASDAVGIQVAVK